MNNVASAKVKWKLTAPFHLIRIYYKFAVLGTECITDLRFIFKLDDGLFFLARRKNSSVLAISRYFVSIVQKFLVVFSVERCSLFNKEF